VSNAVYCSYCHWRPDVQFLRKKLGYPSQEEDCDLLGDGVDQSDFDNIIAA